MTGSQIDDATIQAYLETDYRVSGESPFTLQVGVRSESLADAHANHGCLCSAFLTAANPFSQTIDDATNGARQDALKRELARRGLPFLDGIGTHPSNGWPGEPSVLVLGISCDDAKELGARFEQNAIVWSGADARPQLILLR